MLGPRVLPLRRCRYSIIRRHLGLYGLGRFQAPADFVAQANEAIEICNRLQTLEPSSLTNLDDISRHLCNVMDAAELCRSTHFHEEWRNAAQHAFSLLHEYMQELNTNPQLYRKLMECKPQTKEEKFMMESLKKEFERDGVHLPSDQRAQVREAASRLSQLETLFSQNLLHTKEFQLNDAMERDIQKIYPTLGTLSDHAGLCQTLLRNIPQGEIRKEIHHHFATGAAENLPVLDALVKCRLEYAQRLQLGSFADKVPRMLQNVPHFLTASRTNNEKQFRTDLSQLSMVKQQVEGNATLQAWDIPFYSGLIMASQQRHSEDVVVELSDVLNAIRRLVQNLFGLQIESVPIDSSYAWDDQETTELQCWEFHKDDVKLGTLFWDLHPRPYKFGHAAHFTIQCACEGQLPVVALVANMSKQVGHGHMQTLLHELGHALHSLASRTKFHHVSGTRGPLDFVEMPAHWLEEYAWDTEFLASLGITQNLRDSRDTLASIERHNQILYATLDQDLFGSSKPPPDITKHFASLHEDFGIPYAPGTHWFTRFGHLVTYGASYYSYLHAQGLADRCKDLNLWSEALVYGGGCDPNELMEKVDCAN